MKRRSSILVAGVAAVLAGLVMLAPSEAQAWVSGDWVGRPFFKGGKFLGCVMETGFTPGGRRFRFMQLTNYNLLIGLGRKTPYPPGAKYNFVMQIDGQVVRSAVGLVRPNFPRTLWIRLGTDRDAREKLKKGYTLVLHRAGGRKATRSLAGTYNALERLEACVRNRS